MTREEAIFCEKSYIGETNCVDCKYYGTDTCQSRESHKMAIKALEQEPCEDTISRQAVLDAFWKLDVELRPSAIDAILNMVNDLPSVNPQNDVLDKIKTEIDEAYDKISKQADIGCGEFGIFGTMMDDILSKYISRKDKED